jgi:plastocyanin
LVHRRSLIAGAAALAGLVAAAPAQAVSRKVAVGNFQWSPMDVTVNLGESVTWFWVGPDTQHSITGLSANALQWDSDPGTTAPDHALGDRFSLRFTTPGTYEFHCKLHAIVRGTVTVTPAPGSDAPSPDPDPKVQVDLTAPEISDARWAGRRTVRYTLDEAGRVTLDVEKRRGRRWVLVATRRFDGHVGYNEQHVRGRALARGSYRAFLRAADGDNNQSKDAVVRFRIR